MSKPGDSHFKLVELNGYRERELIKSPSLEDVEEFLDGKTGGGR
jgi:hypothetical protein